MATESATLAHVLDLLDEALGEVRARAMFGGHGLYHGGVMFALIADDQLYFKVDEATRGRFDEAGSRPFVYQGKGKPVTMSYWGAPEGALDAADDLRPWARLGVEAARRGQAKKTR